MDKFEVVVNGVKFPIVQHVVTKGRGKNSGKIKFRPTKDSLTMENLLAAFGSEKLLEELHTRINALSNGITEQALASSEDGKDTGKLVTEFSRMFGELSATGEKLSVLKDRLNELIDEFTSLDENDPKYIEKMKDFKKRINAVHATIQARKPVDDDEEENTDKSKPATVAA